MNLGYNCIIYTNLSQGSILVECVLYLVQIIRGRIYSGSLSTVKNIMDGFPARAGPPRTVRSDPDFSPMDCCPLLTGKPIKSWTSVPI